jgi:hypothetical protein
VSIDVAVMAHSARAGSALALAQQTGARITWDDGNGEWDTGARAWDSIDRGADWGLVLQDDALPIPDMLAHLAEALASAPRTCTSLYVGTGRPSANAVTGAIERASRTRAAWLEHRTLLWGVGVVLPTEDIAPLLAWAARVTYSYDQRIGAWYLGQHRPVRYAWPSLVDHADGPSLVGHSSRRPIARHAHRTGIAPTWDTPAVPF